MPAGYEFSYSESSRRRTDAWIKYAVMVGVAAVAIGGTFWAISKQAKNSKPAKAQSIYELAGTTGTSESPVNNSPIESNGNTAGGLPGEPGVLPSGSIEWDPQSVFNSTVAPEDEESLWNATGARDEPLAPPSSSDFRDPSIPSFDGFK